MTTIVSPYLQYKPITKYEFSNEIELKLKQAKRSIEQNKYDQSNKARYV